MRTIDFRAWDIEDKKFKDWQDIWKETNGEFFGDSSKNPEFIIEQFTNLEDKNGAWIYEGDIVKWGDHCDYCQEFPVRIAIVSIDPDIQFNAKNVHHLFHYGNFAYKDTSHLEVIGNIHENPELIPT